MDSILHGMYLHVLLKALDPVPRSVMAGEDPGMEYKELWTELVEKFIIPLGLGYLNFLFWKKKETIAFVF